MILETSKMKVELSLGSLRGGQTDRHTDRHTDNFGGSKSTEVENWVRDQIRVGSKTKSELAPRANSSWVRHEIRVGSEKKSYLGQRVNRSWVVDQIRFGSETKS